MLTHRASRSARRDAGRFRRREVPLEAHAELPANTTRDPLAALARQDAGRVQELVPIRYGRMSATPFTYLRGAAAVMADDLARAPRTDLTVQLCGDAHLSNFGIFNAPDRRLVFDVNDFDETLPGPFEWDLKRLAASVTVAARANELSAKQAHAATRAVVKGYRRTIEAAGAMSPLDLYYHRIEFDEVLDQVEGDKARRRVEKTGAKASRKNSLRALRKLTDIVDGRRVIVPDPPLVTRVDHILEQLQREELGEFFGRYHSTLAAHRRHLLDHFTPIDMAHKVVGVGSVGTRCLILLLESGGGDPLFLQFKEATTSVLEPHLGASEFDLAGRRVVEGQRLIQAASDVFLGWARWEGSATGRPIDFYFRQLWDGKGSADVAAMGPKGLKRYGRACGAALALAHARSGDPSMISGYVGDDATLDHALADFAEAYADRTESDHGLLAEAIADGRVEAHTDL